MLRHLFKRLAILVTVLLIVNLLSYTIANYLFMWVFPNDPELFFNNPPPEIPETAASPLLYVLSGYPAYLSNLLRGDLGLEFGGKPVIETIITALPRSLILLGLGMLVAAILGVGGGLLSVNRKNRRTNPIALSLSVAGYSLPGFFLAVLIAFQLAVMFRLKGIISEPLLPVSGYGLDRHLILPVLALAVRPAGEIARLTGELLVEELDKPYVRTARAKGLNWRLTILRHAFRNIAANVFVTLGSSLRYLVSTLLIVEWLFNWPGLGRELVPLVLMQFGFVVALDPPLVVGLVTTLTLIALTMSLLAHTASWLIDPRLRRTMTLQGGAR